MCMTLFSVAGCSKDDGSGAIFKYDIDANPKTLDPQMTDDINSELIISNVFMGLLRENADGSLSEGVAENYIVSEDGLTYTFKLRTDVYWRYDGEEKPCTAEDFVYGFKRLFDHDTNAPRAEEYYCIKNSKPVHRGLVPDKSVLGVKALGEYELEISLDYPDPQLPLLLTKAPAMPCNEEFFLKSQGKYGLSAECTASNGAFYVRTWDYDPYSKTENNHLILRRNAKNNETRRVYPQGLNFFIMENGGFVEDFIAGTTSCIAVNDEEAALIEGEFSVEEFHNISVGLVFNRSFDPFRSENFRCALASLVDRDAIGSALAHYESSYAIVPYEVSMLDMGYRELVGSQLTPEYDRERAQELYEKALPQLDKNYFTSARIIVPDESAAQAVSYIMQEWQREFGFYCIVETLSPEDYRTRLAAGDYEMAVVELSGSYNSPAAYLECFVNGAPNNYGKYFNAEFESLMDGAKVALDLYDSAEEYAKAEQVLIDTAAFVPLYYQNEYFYIGEDLADVIYNPFSRTVDFSQAKKF